MPHVGKGSRIAQNPRTLEPVRVPPRYTRGRTLFSYRTRHYLRRRVWRYFRRMGYQQPARYARAVAGMLRLYSDADLASGEALLDSRSLVHACFRGSEVLEFTPGHRQPPRRPRARRVGCGPGARGAVESAGLRGRAAGPGRDGGRTPGPGVGGAGVPAVSFRAAAGFVDRPAPPAARPRTSRPAARRRAARTAAGAGQALRLTTWLRLLGTRNARRAGDRSRASCASTSRRTADARPDRRRRVRRAGPRRPARARVPPRQMLTTPADRETVARLADAQVRRRRGRPRRLGALAPRHDRGLRRRPRRAASSTPDPTDAPGRVGVADASDPRPPAYDDPAFWSRLIETPYDDVRLHLVGRPERRATLPGVSPGTLGPALSGAGPAGHPPRRPRQAHRACGRSATPIADDPARAEPLLPVLAVAIRSVRPPRPAPAWRRSSRRSSDTARRADAVAQTPA